MIDHRVFQKVKDMDELRKLYADSMKKAESELEVRVIEAAAKRAIMRLKEGEK